MVCTWLVTAQQVAAAHQRWTSQACLQSPEQSTMSNKQLLPAGGSVWAAAVNVAGPVAQPFLCELDTLAWSVVWR